MHEFKLVNPPDVTNRYDLLEILKTDSVWTTFKARDHVLKKFVVLKTANNGQDLDSLDRAKFEGYAKALAKLQHPSIESILDYGSINEKPYIVTEFMEGVSLKRYLREDGAPSLDNAFSLFYRICDIIEYVHNQKVILSNLNLDSFLVTKLDNGEFSVALIGLDDAFIAPAVSNTSSVPNKIGQKSKDINDLGIVFGQVITGEEEDSITYLRKTFDGAKNDALMYRRFGFGVMEKIIERCGEEGKTSQYQSVFALKKEISQAQSRLHTWTDISEASLDNKERVSLAESRKLNFKLLSISVYAAILVSIASVIVIYLMY